MPEEKKKWTEEYQPVDENGLPVGPPQKFEADTQQELIQKLKAAHMNASAALYKTRMQVKLGTLLEPDSDEPILTFEEKPLSADERLKITNMLKDPATAPDAYKLLLESQFGAPVEQVRAVLRDNEVQKRVDKIRANVDQFLKETPEYVDSESNRDKIKKYMEKKGYPYTTKNLKIAFDDLANDGLLTVQAPTPKVPSSPAPEPAKVPDAAAPAAQPTIPAEPKKEPEIPAEPTEVRPKQSSSGLGRENSSAQPAGAAPKTVGITIRDINRMSAAEYQDKLKDPEFRKQVEALYAKK